MSKSGHLSVVEINNAIRRRECVFYRKGQTVLAVLKSRTHENIFQAQTETQGWIDVDPLQIFLLKPPRSCVLGVDEVSPQSRTTQHNLEIAFHLLRRCGCGAVDNLEGTWSEAFKKASRWSGLDQQPATILYIQEMGQVSFKDGGDLVSPLLCAWKGDLELLQACLQANNLVATTGEQSFSEMWNCMFIERKHV